MDTITFPCPNCRGAMRVQAALQGRNVRCPHCQAVIQAPVRQAPPPPPPPPPSAEPVYQAPPGPWQHQQSPPPVPTYQAPPTPFTEGPQVAPPPASPPSPWSSQQPDIQPGHEAPVPELQLPPPPIESPESIFGDVEVDDIFPNASQPPQVEMPPEPEQPQAMPEPEPLSPAEDDNPFATFGSSQTPPPPPAFEPAVVPPPPAVEEPPMVARAPEMSHAFEPASPWEAAPVPTPIQEAPTRRQERPEPEPEPEPQRREYRRTAAPAKKGGGFAKLLAALFFFWAAAATAGMVYFGFIQEPPKPSVFETMPDLFGEYGTAERNKTSWNSLPDPDAPLPADLIVPVGGTLRVHDLEVKPTRVSYERLNAVQTREGESEGTARPINDVVGLHLRLTNLSDSVTFHPLDPALVRQYSTASPDRPYTYMQLGRERLYGGTFPWLPNTTFRWQGHEGDFDALRPGESREVIVGSNVRAGATRGRVQSHRGDPILWRVHLRTGLVEHAGQDFSVTSVVGVRFQPTDVN